MRFSFKVFLSTIIVITISFSLGSYFLIFSLFKTSLNREMNISLRENAQLYSSFYTSLSTSSFDENTLTNSIVHTIFLPLINGSESIVKVSDTNGIIYSSDSISLNNSISYEGLKSNSRGYQITQLNNKYYIQVVSKIIAKTRIFYIESVHDVTRLYTERSTYYSLYRIVLLCVVISSSLVMTLISLYLTKPLRQLSISAGKISKGDFGSRVTIKSDDEVGVLASDFNQMAKVIEEKIHELRLESEKKDQFVANFSHELKTPLTSIIGYADSLRSLNMDEESMFHCANYIFKEGKRLELLSLRLMDLIILGKKDYEMVEVSSLFFVNEIKDSIRGVLEKYNCTLNISVSDRVIKVEPTLMKTLFYNLIDNAIKYSPVNSQINIQGYLHEDKYIFEVEDFGQGISENDLLKITAPFYMVDKSRLKKDGYGLGLSICSEIAFIHNTKLNFKSELNQGTVVKFTLGGKSIE